MTAEERKRMNELCARIADEKDPQTFDRLVIELDEAKTLRIGTGEFSNASDEYGYNCTARQSHDSCNSFIRGDRAQSQVCAFR